MKTYRAPFSKLVVTISVVTVVILIGAATALLARAHHPYVGWLPVALLGLAAVYIIRGYSISNDAVFVHRLFWRTRLPVHHLQAVRVDPDAMRGSVRVFGNGGLFSVSGIYRNATLGRYRAYVTDPANAVVLRFPSKTVVLSPAGPEAFAKELEAVRNALRPQL
jgi:hypothetical protein